MTLLSRYHSRTYAGQQGNWRPHPAQSGSNTPGPAHHIGSSSGSDTYLRGRGGHLIGCCATPANPGNVQYPTLPKGAWGEAMTDPLKGKA